MIPLTPGKTIGILGGGQLGKMTAIAAQRMGYDVVTLAPEPHAPAGRVSRLVVGTYDDVEAALEVARSSDVVTVEFEHISGDVLEAVASLRPLFPSPEVVAIARDRIREKTFLRERGYPLPAFHVVRTDADLHEAVQKVGVPAVLKTATGGYDGKGQVFLQSPEEAYPAWEALGRVPCVLEAFVELSGECSVIVARNVRGEEEVFPVAENTHHRHILDTSVMPARISPELQREAQEIAGSLADDLELVGLLCVEFFISREGKILVNELAPRPHNSGHGTFDAAVTSQFEQLVRAITGMPLGSPELYRPVAIANLLGDLWAGGEPAWDRVLHDPFVKLHLYGKRDPRPGRKMGHLTATGTTPDEALHRVLTARQRLESGGFS